MFILYSRKINENCRGPAIRSYCAIVPYCMRISVRSSYINKNQESNELAKIANPCLSLLINVCTKFLE